MTARYVKQGDRAHPFTATLKDNTGTAVNLTGATVNFVMRLTSWAGPTPPAPKVNAAATVVNPTLGTVSYTSGANDLDTVGTYDVEWKVTFAGGLPQRFPGDGYNQVAVRDNLE